MKSLFAAFVFIMLYNSVTISQENIELYNDNEIEEIGNYKNALNSVKKLLELDSLNADLWAETGRLYRLDCQLKNSITAFEKALQLDPSNKKFLINLARVNKLAAKKDNAISLYYSLLKLDQFNVMALNDLADIYSLSGMSDSAASLFQRLYSNDTLNINYLSKWAYHQWNSGKTDEAFVNYKKAISLDSTFLPVVFDLARIFVKLKMQDSAIHILEKNSRVYPTESRLFADIGNANFSKPDYINAIPNYKKALELGFKGIDVYKRLAICYYSLHEYENSRLNFEKVIEKDTSDYKVCMYLGHIYNTLNQPEKGLDFLNRSLALLTPDPMVIATIYSGIEDSYRDLKKYNEQIIIIQKRQESLPIEYKSAKYLLEIAEIYENNLMDKQNALKYYQDYYNEIKNLNWLSQESKNSILQKINKLKKTVN